MSPNSKPPGDRAAEDVGPGAARINAAIGGGNVATPKREKPDSGPWVRPSVAEDGEVRV